MPTIGYHSFFMNGLLRINLNHRFAFLILRMFHLISNIKNSNKNYILLIFLRIYRSLELIISLSLMKNIKLIIFKNNAIEKIFMPCKKEEAFYFQEAPIGL
jgi:hypothetical protein